MKGPRIPLTPRKVFYEVRAVEWLGAEAQGPTTQV